MDFRGNGRAPRLEFAFVGAHLGRQFEFVQSQWINDGVFFGPSDAKDPIVGSNDGTAGFSVPLIAWRMSSIDSLLTAFRDRAQMDALPVMSTKPGVATIHTRVPLGTESASAS
jgi:hypothetical protein